MDSQSRKKSILFIIVLVLVFAGYQTYINYNQVNRTQRSKDYVAGIKHGVNGSDSIVINAFYTKLCVVNDLISNDTLESETFSIINKQKIPKDFQVHICTKNYLEFICNTNSQSNLQNDIKHNLPHSPETEIQNGIDAYLGLASFSRNIAERNWNGSVKSEITNFEKDSFLMVIDFSKIVSPDFNEQADSYTAGNCEGKISVVNINSGKLVAVMRFFAKNDERIVSAHLIKAAMDEKLRKNLIDNIIKELSRCAVAFYDRPLKTKDAEIYQ